MNALYRPAARGTEWRAGALALLVHVAFLILLVFGVSWQRDESAPAMAEIWNSLPAAQPQPAPRPEPTPKPEPAPKPEPRPAPKPRPAPEPAAHDEPAPAKPDIALEKARVREREKKARQAELDLQAQVARAAEEKKQREAQQEAKLKSEAKDLQRQMMEESLANDSRQVKQLAAQAAASRRAGAVSGVVDQYKALISAKVRGNTRLPDDLKGNPQVKFQVSLLPTGEVLNVKLVQSSGNPAYDDAVERAIYHSSPLPLPEDRDARAAFVPVFVSVHRPKE